LNLKGDQTTIDQTSDFLKLGGKPVRRNSIKRLESNFQLDRIIAASLVSWFEMREDALLPSPRSHFPACLFGRWMFS
jgi:hypothetical protein